MRKAWLILLLLAGCGSKDETDGEAAAGPSQDPLANLALASPGEDAARLQALIDRAMPIALKGAKDAQYRNVRAGAGGSACGEVATKPAPGRAPVFRPFVITSEGIAVVGETARIAFEDPSDFLADAYIRWCATPEELEKIGPALQGASGNEVSAVEPPPLPAEDPLPVPLPGPAAPPPAASPPKEKAPPAPPPRPEIDSFFNSVQRKGG